MKTRWIAGALALVFLLVMHEACVEVEPLNPNNPIIPCEEDCDCYTDFKYLLGTECIEGICQCPRQFEDTYKFPCCKKGTPPDACRRRCRRLGECDPDVVDVKYLPPGTVWPPVEEDAGAGGSGGASASSDEEIGL